MGLVGADIGLLRELVAQLGGPMQSNLNAVLAEMNNEVQGSSAYWVAEDGDKFRAAFAAFVRSARTQLDGTLATAAKVTGQNLQAIGTATGNASGKQATSSPAPGSGLEPLSYYFSPARLIPNPDNLVPDPWTHLLSTESKAFILGGPRFLLRHYDGEGLVADPGDAVPAWTTKYVAGTKFAGLGVSVLNQALETYSEGEAEHWSTGKLWAETIGQGVVIGGTSGASSWWAGTLVSPYANKIASNVAAKFAKPATEQTAEEAQNSEAEEQTAEAAEQAEAGAEATAETELAAATAEEQAVGAAAQAVTEAEAAAAQAVAEAQSAAAETLAETVAAAAENATQGVAEAAAQAATQATAAAQSAEEAVQAAEQIAAEAEQAAQQIAAQAAEAVSQASASAAQATREAAAARAAAQTGAESVAETGTETTVEAGAETAVEAGTEVAVEAGTDVAVEAGAETAAEALTVIGTDSLIGAALGSEVPIIGNVVGLVVGFAVGAAVSFVASKVGTAVGHAIWDAGGDTVHEADHLFHDIFL